MKSRFVLVSRWLMPAPRERVWELLVHPERWPHWWPRLESARRTVPGAADGLGAVTEFRWNSGLGYRIEFAVATVRVQEPIELEGEVRGEEHATAAVGLDQWQAEIADPAAEIEQRGGPAIRVRVVQAAEDHRVEL